MCLAVPHRIEELRGDGSAIATAGPIRRSIRVDALPGAQVGDLVLEEIEGFDGAEALPGVPG